MNKKVVSQSARDSRVRNRKYPLIHQFEQDHEFVDYYLGFHYGDGSIICTNGDPRTLRYSSTDKQIVDDITARLQYSREVSVDDSNPKKSDGVWKAIYYNQVYSIDIDRFLVLGLRPNKDDIRLNELKIQNFYAFLRGLVDSDGCIGVYKDGDNYLHVLQFTCRKKFAYELKHELHVHGISSEVSKCKANAWSVAVHKGGVIKLLELMYPSENVIKLQRKYEKVKQIIAGVV